MKNFIFLFLFLLSAALNISCSKNEEKPNIDEDLSDNDTATPDEDADIYDVEVPESDEIEEKDAEIFDEDNNISESEADIDNIAENDESSDIDSYDADLIDETSETDEGSLDGDMSDDDFLLPCPDYIDLADAPDEDLFSVASFNMLRLGYNNGKDYPALACIIKNFSLVGVVELMNETGILTLQKSLKDVTGKKWDYLISEYSVGRSTYKEYYGFIWQESKVTLQEDLGFYPEIADEFEREPYGAKFQIGSMDLTLVVHHTIYGDTIAQRRAEAFELIEVYNYFQAQNGADSDVIIAGDFNLPYDPTYFTLTGTDNIINTIAPSTLTTIGDSGLSSSYDNMFYSIDFTTEFVSSGVIDYTMDNYSTLNTTVSDHLPVYMILDTATDND